jgi:beta-glucanase (GH16 family)
VSPRTGLAALLAAVLLAQSFAADSAWAAEGRIVSGPVFDDFLGPAGAAPNPHHWVHDVGPSPVHGWEHGSLQTYTDSPDNVRLDGYGNLVIEARRAGDGYTSGRIVTRGKLSFTYGTVVARMKLPSGQGLWPAFWMLGADIDTVGWPQAGEIDIIELINTGTQYNIALHAPGADIEQKGPIDDLSRDFHNYWMTRTPDRITVGIDESTLANFTKSSFPDQWVFDRPMFALLNLAVGGTWPGPPDGSTPFPSAMIVDWFSFTPPESAQALENTQE